MLAVALSAPVAMPVVAQELTAQQQVVLDGLPEALRAQILALSPAERQRLVAAVAALPPEVVLNLSTLAPAQFVAVATLPPAQVQVIAALPPADRVVVASAVAEVKANVAAGNVAGMEAAIANLAQAMSVVPEASRATLSVAVATDVARSVEDAPAAVRQAASQAVAGAAAIASNPEIVGAANVISEAVLQQIIEVAEAVSVGTPIDEVIAAIEESVSPTG